MLEIKETGFDGEGPWRAMTFPTFIFVDREVCFLPSQPV